MNRDTRRLEAAIDATLRASRRLRWSLEEDAAMLANAIESESAENDHQLLRAVDAFVQRFQQMHEHMMHRLYPAIYRTEQLGERPPPTRPLLTWLEELGLIETTRSWADRAEIRNRLVHEYPLDPVDRRRALSAAMEHSQAMLSDFDHAIQHVNARRLLNEGE